ncbi:MAG TPA: hypothetical protein VFA04_12130 [Bryobacteraceae bacterium]|nr:hypothetical protein [Bryobacteraceae bacterium]
MATARLGFVVRETHYSCAELVEVTWPHGDGAYSEFAILAEIWSRGGVLLAEEEAAPETPIHISLPHAEVTGTVRSCRRERCSYALEVSVDATEEWFGGRYRPAVLDPAEVSKTSSALPAGRSAELAMKPLHIQPRAL